MLFHKLKPSKVMRAKTLPSKPVQPRLQFHNISPFHSNF